VRHTSGVMARLMLTLLVASTCAVAAAGSHSRAKWPPGAAEFCGPAGVHMKHGHFACVHYVPTRAPLLPS
jgi:hypothetical protein